jgi:transcriptional regulator HMO1
LTRQLSMPMAEQHTRPPPARRPPPLKLSAASSASMPHQSALSVNAYKNDQVIVSLTNLQNGLSHVQNGINDLLRAYMNHTSSILAGEAGQLDSLQVPLNAIEGGPASAGAAGSGPNPAAAAPAGAAGDSKRKRKREKKERDPNAPKRPLTAAFLFSQHARPIVRRDLEAALPPGGKLEPNAVNIEVTRRWNVMPDEEKEVSPSAPSSQVLRFDSS